MIVHLIHFYLNLFVYKLSNSKSLLLAKFACAYPAVKFSGANFVNSWNIICLLWSGLLVILFLISVIFIVILKLLTLGILFLTSFILTLKSVVVPNLVILGISFLASFILALRVVLVAKLLISGVLSPLFFISE